MAQSASTPRSALIALTQLAKGKGKHFYFGPSTEDISSPGQRAIEPSLCLTRPPPAQMSRHPFFPRRRGQMVTCLLGAIAAQKYVFVHLTASFGKPSKIPGCMPI